MPKKKDKPLRGYWDAKTHLEWITQFLDEHPNDPNDATAFRSDSSEATLSIGDIRAIRILLNHIVELQAKLDVATHPEESMGR